MTMTYECEGDLLEMFPELPPAASVEDFAQLGFVVVEHGGLQLPTGDFVVVLRRHKWCGVGFR